ncbi:hypothetical protein V8J88_20060 [Massilia sp. W12]|uniref:glycine-rich domain-containing protein n=1 Tax=Massilia sp. W12 TaxID=3126507 RepID=UPI0030D16F51
MIPYIYLLLPVCVLAIALGMRLWRLRRQRQQRQRQHFIRHYQFPAALFGKMRQHIPHLDQASYLALCAALRQFFLACSNAPGQQLEMPSQAVDLLWHEFILCTRQYEDFCQRAFGRFLHHAPAGSGADGAILPSWRSACAAENINPQQPERMPSLFALDDRLGLAAPILWSVAAGSLLRSGADGHTQHYSLAHAYHPGALESLGAIDSAAACSDYSGGADCSSDSGGSCSGGGCSGGSD